MAGHPISAGPWADDARFKVCESYNRLSPKPQLDQQYTQAARDHCKLVGGLLSDHEYVEPARGFVAVLSSKLAEKQFKAGDFYYKRGAIDPAAILYSSPRCETIRATGAAPRSCCVLSGVHDLGYRKKPKRQGASPQGGLSSSDEAKACRPRPWQVIVKTGIFGGTFDPPHLGHLIAAQDACIQLALDRVLFVPAGQPRIS